MGRVTAEDDDREMSREEIQRAMEAERARSVVTAADKLRALDLVEAAEAGDFDKVLEIVVKADTAGETIADGLAPTRSLLLAYISYSLPLDKATIAQARRRIVDEELPGIVGDDGGD